MKIPQRIQRKRTPGFRQPPNCRYCGRGTKYGNDYKVVVIKGATPCYSVYNPKTLYRSYMTFSEKKAHEHAVEMHKIQMEQNLKDNPAFYDDLLNYDYISCFCPKHLPCHCDPIIEHLTERIQQLQAVTE